MGHHRIAWLDNFTAQVEAHRAELNLPEATLTALKAQAAEAHAKAAANAQAQAAARHATEEKKASRRAVEATMRGAARLLKADPGYTEVRGRLLGIVGPEAPTDDASLKRRCEPQAHPQRHRPDRRRGAHRLYEAKASMASTSTSGMKRPANIPSSPAVPSLPMSTTAR